MSCCLPFDEMYLQKCEETVGTDEDGELYKRAVCFMIIGLKSNIPYVYNKYLSRERNSWWMAQIRTTSLHASATKYWFQYQRSCLRLSFHQCVSIQKASCRILWLFGWITIGIGSKSTGIGRGKYLVSVSVV